MTSSFCGRSKVVAAAIGAGVVVAMGALTVALSGPEVHPVTAHLVADATSTQTTPPSVLQTPAAKPPVTAKKWKGGGWQGQ